MASAAVTPADKPLIRQARQALARGQLAEAERLAGQALQAHPGAAAARDVMARVHLRHKRPEAAAGLLAPIAEDPATPVETLILFGNALWQGGEQERARDAYGLAVTRDPESGAAWMSHCMTQLPFLYDDEAHLMTCRTRYAQRLAEMAVHFRAGGSERLARLHAGVSAAMPFRTAYQGLETRALQAAYGALVGEAAAARFPALA
ncbi:MAG: tetratricopeptide repeat protein, partial [Alphaproteobacteria bacterium]|nr:tetratricopeptide repeat protein [Alphaproteobacteria bacterium]